MTQVLTLLGRRDCHLCEEMQHGLADLVASGRIALRVVDVDEDPVLLARHGLDVPVLMCAARVLCMHRLDREALLACLNSQ